VLFFLATLTGSLCIQLQDMPSATRTLDLASSLEVGSAGALRGSSDAANTRSVLTIAFQFSFENHLRENVAAMARQYVRAVMASVQRVAMAIAPSRLGAQIQMKHPPGSPEAITLASWIGRSYRSEKPSTQLGTLPILKSCILSCP
jgi:homeobox-leucine zipper protein